MFLGAIIENNDGSYSAVGQLGVKLPRVVLESAIKNAPDITIEEYFNLDEIESIRIQSRSYTEPKPLSRKQKTRADFQKNRDELYTLILERGDKEQCSICEAKRWLTVDHIMPISKGGNNELSNLQILCKLCNSSKGSKYA